MATPTLTHKKTSSDSETLCKSQYVVFFPRHANTVGQGRSSHNRGVGSVIVAVAVTVTE